MEDKDKHHGYNIVYHQNSYDDNLWYAFHRRYWTQYWTGGLPAGTFLKAKNIKHLIEAVSNGALKDAESDKQVIEHKKAVRSFRTPKEA